ncbi:DeoR/GlpR family DNA-binding transcription regulator [Klebsiella pneumoniae]|uniref:DeoR/GlpR family DNA-binding transcription regulator n=1 Tax=Klebsiella pneumoniae TaxID=573 RepID=UPI001F5BD7EE|nr:DeoR/GlpR family DNA-binding transcription regulator [Klebsiella pneumoniae]
MLPLERHRLIVELLGQHGVMRVNEIAQATRVSRETIRRDLSELERKGILTRSHGGALAAENPLPATRAAASALPVEDSQGNFQHRTLLHSEGKMRVARKALQFLKPGQTIVLDGSSTSWFMARQMPEMALTVITPSIRILQTLMSRRSLHLVGLGGDFSPTEESFFGETASRTLREYAIDTLFFSCQGLERDSGLYAGTQAHAALLKQMLLAARQTVALVDGSKLGRTGVARIGGLGELDCLVTERFVDPLLEKEMTWHNIVQCYKIASVLLIFYCEPFGNFLS